MDPLPPRLADIVRLANEKGHVWVADLAARFGVSAQTIRKDLNALCARRLLHRVHGGAVARSGVDNFAYEERRRLAAGAKRRIGAAAAALIEDNSSLFINIGTTTEQAARALRRRQGLLVITNNLNVAGMLHHAPRTEVIIAGGLVRAEDGGVVGETATETFRRFRADAAIIGVSAIDAEGTLLDFDIREVSAARAIVENARRRILVADAMKFSRAAPVRICRLAEMDTLVTDAAPPPEIARICAENDVEIIVADEE